MTTQKLYYVPTSVKTTQATPGMRTTVEFETEEGAIVTLYLPERIQGWLAAGLQRDGVTSYGTHTHTGRCGDLHKFEGQAWADEALNREETP